MPRKLLLAIGILIVLVIIGTIYIIRIAVSPTDTRIVQVLQENEEFLLGIHGVVGAGIARDENNRTVGITVYVKDGMTEVQEIPNRLNGFNIYIKKMSEATEIEKEMMIIVKNSSGVTGGSK